MRKSKYGYILLALLVTTGLAGTITSTSITNKERKFAANLMKDAKTDLSKMIKGLSKKQFNFKASRDKWSIRECIFHMAIAEKNLFEMVETAMKQPANPEKRSEIKITDEQLAKMMEDQSCRRDICATFDLKNAKWKTSVEALDAFNDQREQHLKYIKFTTENLRDHVVRTSLGWMDCYQVCIMMAAHSHGHIQQLDELKTAANFPKG